MSDMVSVDETDQAPPMEMLELDQVFAVLPTFAQPFKGIAMVVWGVIQEALGSFSKLLGMIFGVPLCEGPAVLIACMMITAVTGGLFFWLNFDQLGLLDAGKRAIRSTQPLVNKGIRTGAIAGATSVVFILAQCMVLMLQRALSLAFERPLQSDASTEL